MPTLSFEDAAIPSTLSFEDATPKSLSFEDAAPESQALPSSFTPNPYVSSAPSVEEMRSLFGSNDPNYSRISEWDPSLAQKIRTSQVGRAIFGPTEVEKEAMPSHSPAPMELVNTAFKFASVPPPLAEEIRTMTSPMLHTLPGSVGGAAEGLQDLALNLPLAAGGVALGENIGKVMLGIFGGDFVLSVPEQARAFDEAWKRGDKRGAAKIAVEAVGTGTLLGFGAAHEISNARRPTSIEPTTSLEGEPLIQPNELPIQRADVRLNPTAETIKPDTLSRQVEPIAPVAPESAKPIIVRPVLVDSPETRNVIASSRENHAKAQQEASRAHARSDEPYNQDYIDSLQAALKNDAQHMFEVTMPDGTVKVLDRAAAGKALGMDEPLDSSKIPDVNRAPTELREVQGTAEAHNLGKSGALPDPATTPEPAPVEPSHFEKVDADLSAEIDKRGGIEKVSKSDAPTDLDLMDKFSKNQDAWESSVSEKKAQFVPSLSDEALLRKATRALQSSVASPENSAVLAEVKTRGLEKTLKGQFEPGQYDKFSKQYEQAKSPVEPPKAEVKPVSKAVDKIETQVSKVAAEEGQRSAKDIKEELVNRIEQAIMKAPTAADAAGKAEKVTIDIPGDGTFTVVATQENLHALLKRAKKIDTASGWNKAKVSKAQITSSQKVMEGQRRNEEAARIRNEPPPAEPKGPKSMGGLAPGDPTEPVGKSPTGNPDIYGIAERVREERAKSGQVSGVEPGEGISAPDSVEHGRKLLSSGRDPEKSLSDFEKTKRLSSDDMALVRAKGEELARAARRIEEKFGTHSPEYKMAWDALSDWDKRSKAMQTEWHKTGQAQQGETDIDTGSFTGLQRAFKDATGKDFTSAQERTAKETVAKVTKAQEEAATAKQKLIEALNQLNKEKVEPHVRLIADKLKGYLDKRATDALARIKARRAEGRLLTGIDPSELADYADYGASKILNKGIEGAEMTAEWAKEMADEIGDYIKPHLKQIWAFSRDTLDKQLKKVAGVGETGKKVKRALKSTASTAETVDQVRKVLEGHKAGGTFTLDQVRAIWNYAKGEYLENGITDFDDIRNRIATDLGLPVKEVTKGLAQPKSVRNITNEAWKKQQTARRLDQQAKRWLKEATLPLFRRAIDNVPKVLFSLKVGFHGTVALGTHAPMVAFQPQFWKTYIQNFGKMYKMVGSPAYYEMQVQDLLRRPNYTTARRAGLVNDPFQYEDLNSPDTTKYLESLTGMGNRGYSVLKMLRQDMFDQQWGKLPESAKIPEVASAIADGLNHATGVVKVNAPKGAAIALFAPRLLMSRVSWLAGDPLRAADTFLRWKSSSEAEKIFAINQVKEKAIVAGTMYGLLALNQGMLTATGDKQKINFTDPMKSDFLKFKAAGMTMSYGNAMISQARLPARLWQIRESSGGKLKNLIHPDENTYSVLGEYARSQESPFASLITSLWFKSDWQNRPLPNSNRPVPKRLAAQGVEPYTWPEFWTEQVLPIPFEEAAREVWHHGLGMSDEQIRHMTKATTTILFMSATGGRLTEDREAQK